MVTRVAPAQEPEFDSGGIGLGPVVSIGKESAWPGAALQMVVLEAPFASGVVVELATGGFPIATCGLGACANAYNFCTYSHGSEDNTMYNHVLR